MDADHAGDAVTVTRKSRTGFIVFINNAPVYWDSKRQGSVESSTYQAEFTAMKARRRVSIFNHYNADYE